MNRRTAALAASLLALAGCADSGAGSRPEIWIYTSLYAEVIAEMEPLLAAAVPEVQVHWFQGGSEIVASRLNAELAAGAPGADLILTSDPFWYRELEEAGHLLPYESPAAAGVPTELRDPEHAFTTVRIPVMVLGYNPEAVPEGTTPDGWEALVDSRWHELMSMGSPLESGTTFTAVALLQRQFGWEYFTALREQEVMAAGGNSSVITRMETRERPIGMVLLENILAARARGSPVQPIYPTDGAIPVPSPIAIMSATKAPDAARKVYDWFFSDEAQTAMVRAGMYSPLPGRAAPEGALPWEELAPRLMRWSPEILEEIFAARDSIKARFSEIVLR